MDLRKVRTWLGSKTSCKCRFELSGERLLVADGARVKVKACCHLGYEAATTSLWRLPNWQHKRTLDLLGLQPSHGHHPAFSNSFVSALTST